MNKFSSLCLSKMLLYIALKKECNKYLEYLKNIKLMGSYTTEKDCEQKMNFNKKKTKSKICAKGHKASIYVV